MEYRGDFMHFWGNKMKIAFLSLLLMASVASADDRSYRTTTQRPIKSGSTTHVYTNVHGSDGKITRYSTRIQDNGKSNIRTSTKVYGPTPTKSKKK
jgi:hypothetical protein